MPTRKKTVSVTGTRAPGFKAVGAKPADKPAAAPPQTPATPVARELKPAEPAKAKLVRDSFTMPKVEYAVIDALKQRAAKLAQPAKKSELLRAGIKALSAMNDRNLRLVLQSVPTIKTGRPRKG